MKITFEDGSYLKIEASKENPKNVLVTILARDEANPSAITTLSVDVDKEDFLSKIEELKS